MERIRSKTLLMLILVGFISCSGKSSDSEKKIAILENKIKELEGDKRAPQPQQEVSPSPSPSPPISQQEKPEGPLPSFSWEKSQHDFGTINENDVVKHTFKFKNTGNAPLIIESVKPSCGCTAPNWTKKPVLMGEEGIIDVEFDSKGRKNAQNKAVTVIANTWPTQTILRFKAFVTPKN